MKKYIALLCLISLFAIPGLSFAKGVPLFFQTGDELFEIDGAPTFEEGYKVGYACKRFGLFGADVWTWGCEIMAINIEEFSAGDLDPDLKDEMQAKYSLSDRKRNIWNHYGAIALGLVLVGGIAVKSKD
jgi:hypothetical protein